MSKDKKQVGSRGGKKPFINTRLKRTTHQRVSIFAAREGLTLDDAIALRFSDIKE